MKKIQNNNNYDLEERTLNFARDTRLFCSKLPKSGSNLEDTKQLIRSSGSIGANYIEANESLSKKDFYMRIKICRKEAKESTYWLRLLEISEQFEAKRLALIDEATQLMKIFGSIISKSKI